MFVKTSFKGEGTMKYMIASLLVKVMLFVAFVMVSIPYGVEIIDHIQAFANTATKLDLYFILKQCGWILLNFIGAVIIEVFVLFVIIFPIAKNELFD